jgi:hypothetical protein
MAKSNHGIRKYIVYYYAEKNDECVDCEMVIEAKSIFGALYQFKQRVRIFKRVFCIEEKRSQ